MKKHKYKHKKMEEQDKKHEDPEVVEATDFTEEAEETTTAEPTTDSEIEQLKAALEKEKKDYLFLMADFDNFRKRTLKEKSDLIRNGAEAAMKGLLPIVDDFERGLQAVTDTEGAEAVKEGMTLIYNKFVKYLEQNGVKAMDSTGSDFNDELHEAVALVPGPEEQKGKVIDTLQKGYTLNDKVLRHAKVAVGQ